MAQAHVIPQATPKTLPLTARTIGIVGSGSVGPGIAQLALLRGFAVRIVDGDPGVVERTRAAVAAGLDWLAARGRLDGVEAGVILSRLEGGSDFRDLAGAALVIEASDGDLDRKQGTLRELDLVLGPETVLAVECAGLSVTKLAAAAKRPERVVGLHFMEPVAVADLVEVVRAMQTSDAAHDEACRLVRLLGKTLVSTKDQPGFLVHRLLIPFINEACFALQEGLGSAEDIDTAAQLGAESTGPLRMADSIGLDRCLFMAEYLQREFGDDKYRPATILRNYVAAGWLGRKARRGFYVYA